MAGVATPAPAPVRSIPFCGWWPALFLLYFGIDSVEEVTGVK